MKNTVIQIITAFVLLLLIVVVACTEKKEASKSKIASEVKNVNWCKNAVVYEVNIRQYSPEGTFKAFTKDLPRLKEMGVDILWFMPVFPIGEVNRKVSQTGLIEEVKNPAERKKYLGSYYSTKDYYNVNPEFGTLSDFKAMIDTIHKLGMYVILDIAINHTAWDNAWITEHPDFYTRIEKGRKPWNAKWIKEHPDYYKRIEKLGMTYPINPEETDWWDVAELNFDNQELRKELNNVFKFWIEKFNVDGYRCDYSKGIPQDYWDELRPELEKLKPVFMLSESELPSHHLKAFDMTYDWKMHHIMNDIAKGKKNANAITQHFEWADTAYPVNSFLMQFTSNHDENSWNGTEFERLDGGAQTFAVLSATVPGMLLIYNGQEAPLKKRLRFFEKDTINWGNYEYSDFYKRLIQLKKQNTALWNGTTGGSFERINTTDNKAVYAFVREKEESKVVVITNLTNKPKTLAILSKKVNGNYKDIFSGQTVSLHQFQKLVLTPWQYMVLEK